MIYIRFPTPKWRSSRNKLIHLLVCTPWNKLMGFIGSKLGTITYVNKSDLWSLDDALAPMLLKAVQKFREAGHSYGYGYIDPEDAPEELRGEFEDDYSWDNLAQARFEWALGEMEFALAEIANGNKGEEKFFPALLSDLSSELVIERVEGKEVNPLTGNKETVFKISLDTTESVKEKVDFEGYDVYHTRISHGMLLFGKYFRSLWT